jgi:curved DNA-binding protein CbpA
MPKFDINQKDYYDTLGVNPGATPDEMKRAYKEKAKKVHPDAVEDKSEAGQQKAKEAFQELNNAYHTLKDDEARAEYDRENAWYQREKDREEELKNRQAKQEQKAEGNTAGRAESTQGSSQSNQSEGTRTQPPREDNESTQDTSQDYTYEGPKYYANQDSQSTWHMRDEFKSAFNRWGAFEDTFQRNADFDVGSKYSFLNGLFDQKYARPEGAHNTFQKLQELRRQHEADFGSLKKRDGEMNMSRKLYAAFLQLYREMLGREVKPEDLIHALEVISELSYISELREKYGDLDDTKDEVAQERLHVWQKKREGNPSIKDIFEAIMEARREGKEGREGQTRPEGSTSTTDSASRR